MRIVSEVISALKIADALTVGEVLHSKGIYSSLQSSRVNAQKKLNELVALGQLERGDGFYRTLDCRSEYKPHSKLLTQVLSEVLKLPVTSIIHREVTTPVGLRPDAIVLLTRENQGFCFVLEVLINETEQYYQQKVNTWNHWPDALVFLSELFKYKIPHYEVFPVTVIDGFKTFLKEVV